LRVPPTPIEVAPDVLARIQELYDRGLNLQAWRTALEAGPLRHWAGSARTLAGRLAANLGAPRLSSVLHWLAWRADKRNPDFVAYHAYGLLHRRGPMAAWEFLGEFGEPPGSGNPDGLMHLWSIHGMVAAHLRDFQTAHDCYRRASERAPDNPWVMVLLCHILEVEDRYEEALEAGWQSLRQRPFYRPGVQAVAHVLQLLDRDGEALELLSQAAQKIENVALVQQLASLQMDRRMYAEAAANLDRCEELAPLMEPHVRTGILNQRIALACYRRDLEAVLRHAKKAKDPYHGELVKRIQAGHGVRAVRLGVPFVRQHHLTCAPATLSALSRFWNRPAEHLEIAEAICYDGTPAHSERLWAETNGWLAQEFTITWEAAVTLLDRGIPFTLTTSEATSAHLQAVIGYDELRQTLWIRDPFFYYTTEFQVGPLLERYQATGPRGMVMVARERAELLDGIKLPDREMYDDLHVVQRALAEHRRTDAAAKYEAMQQACPGHRLTLAARRALAAYDDNTPALLECLDELLKQFPKDGNLNLTKLGCLRDLAHREARLKMLAEMCAGPEADPVFWLHYGQELRADAREQKRAAAWMRQALRARPTDPDMVSAWADLLWDRRSFEQATKYYRLAACLGDRREHFARNYFLACRHLRQTEAAVAFLGTRERRLGSKSAAPTITLAESLQYLARSGEAFEALERAATHSPQDGALRLFGADFYGRFARFETAELWLNLARDRAPLVAWHRCAATVAGYKNEKGAALSHWREVARLDPLNYEAARAIAALLAETEGVAKALQFLDETCHRFPFACPLLSLRIEWLQNNGDPVPPLREFLKVNPVNTWAWRELALQCASRRWIDEAMQAAIEAVRLEPQGSYNHSVLGDVLLQAGRIAEARQEFREAIRLEVDNVHAIANFVGQAPTVSARRTALAEIAEELRRQVIFSDALFAYQNAARGVLSADEVLQLLRDAHGTRPDLWQSWSVLAGQLRDMGAHDEAASVTKAATERFPLIPRLWVDKARVEQARLNAVEQMGALRKALEISPAYNEASRELASLHERENDLALARGVLEQALVATPLDGQTHAQLGFVLWKAGERQKAVERVRQAVQLLPALEWGWNLLREWARELGQPQLALEAARELTERRGGEARSWLLLAKCQDVRAAGGEALAALDRALALDARFDEAHDYRAFVLASLGRFEEALRACDPPELQPVPAQLKFRSAWIEAHRGNLAGAIAKARIALAEHPEFYGGWQLLSDWCVQTEQADEAVQAAERMAQLAPLDPVPLGYLGELKLKLGDREGATTAFERAFRLEPDYEYAGYQLFHIHLEAKAYKKCESTLAILGRRGENERTLCAFVELAAARQQYDEGVALFKRLCEHAGANQWHLSRAANALDSSGRGRRVRNVLQEQVALDRVNPAVAEFWVEREIAANNWSLHKRLASLQGNGEAGRRAVFRYLDGLGDALRVSTDVFRKLRLRHHARRVVGDHREWFRADVEGWGKVGYVLTCAGRADPVIEWLSDWKQRPNAESWMLYNLSVMLQRARQDNEAYEVIRHAVELRHTAELYIVFRLWAAFEEALRHNRAAAEQHLTALSAEAITDERRPLFEMSKLLIEATADGVNRKQMLTTIKSRLREAFNRRRPYQADAYTKRAYLRFLDKVSHHLAATNLWLWGRWFYWLDG
jgi:cellulose synthase operon protein C